MKIAITFKPSEVPQTPPICGKRGKWTHYLIEEACVLLRGHDGSHSAKPSKDLPVSLDRGDVENCTGDPEIYCPYADVFGCVGKEEHDKEHTERQQKLTRLGADFPMTPEVKEKAKTCGCTCYDCRHGSHCYSDEGDCNAR